MANGKIRFGKQSGGQLALVFPDGVDYTEVLLPESGTLATEQYVDDNVLLSPNDSRVKTALNATGTAPIYACRAWVNFNGAETVNIRASGNVSSITDNGVGNYTVNFATAMPDDKYSIIGMSGDIQAGERPLVRVILVANMQGNYELKTVNAVKVAVNGADAFEMNLAIFR